MNIHAEKHQQMPAFANSPATALKLTFRTKCSTPRFFHALLNRHKHLLGIS